MYTTSTSDFNRKNRYRTQSSPSSLSTSQSHFNTEHNHHLPLFSTSQSHFNTEHNHHLPLSLPLNHTSIQNTIITFLPLYLSITLQYRTQSSPSSLSTSQSHFNTEHKLHLPPSLPLNHTSIQNTIITFLPLYLSITLQYRTQSSPSSLSTSQSHFNTEHNHHLPPSLSLNHTSIQNTIITFLPLYLSITLQYRTQSSPSSLSISQSHFNTEHNHHLPPSLSLNHTSIQNTIITFLPLYLSITLQYRTQSSPSSLSTSQSHFNTEHNHHLPPSLPLNHTSIQNTIITFLPLYLSITLQYRTQASPSSLSTSQSHFNTEHNHHLPPSLPLNHTSIQNTIITFLPLYLSITLQYRTQSSPSSLSTSQSHFNTEHNHHLPPSLPLNHTSIQNTIITFLPLYLSITLQYRTQSSPSSLSTSQSHFNTEHNHHLPPSLSHFNTEHNHHLPPSLMVSARLEYGRSWVRAPVGSKLVFVAFPLSTQHSGERAMAEWLGIRIMCPSGATCLPADCCFSELAL